LHFLSFGSAQEGAENHAPLEVGQNMSTKKIKKKKKSDDDFVYRDFFTSFTNHASLGCYLDRIHGLVSTIARTFASLEGEGRMPALERASTTT
jgi:hypothetical protein